MVPAPQSPITRRSPTCTGVLVVVVDAGELVVVGPAVGVVVDVSGVIVVVVEAGSDPPHDVMMRRRAATEKMETLGVMRPLRVCHEPILGVLCLPGEAVTLLPVFATSAAIFSLLLVITGVAKVVSPHDVERALVALGLPRIPYAGALVGVVEVAVGITALFASVGVMAQGVLYLAFALWVLVALRADVPLASCGCLGKDDTPPSWGHFFLNIIATAVTLGAIGAAPLDLSLDLEGITRIVLVAVGVFLAYVVLTDGARLSGVRAR